MCTYFLPHARCGMLLRYFAICIAEEALLAWTERSQVPHVCAEYTAYNSTHSVELEGFTAEIDFWTRNCEAGRQWNETEFGSIVNVHLLQVMSPKETKWLV